MGQEFKQVTQEEFRSFLVAYPGKLSYDLNRICEPYMSSYYDWSKATSPSGTKAHCDEARRAYQIHAESFGLGPDKFFVRLDE
jgi:hypothetical protein